MADIRDIKSVNVNILTHLESSRIEYLVQQEGLDFAAAKQQARQEVLKLFGFTLPENTLLEDLNLSDDAMLLAASSIMQGYLGIGELSELLANISADIKTDGELNNLALGSQLKNNLAFIHADQIQANLNAKYSDSGNVFSVTTEELNKCFQDFRDNTTYEQTLFITYPEKGRYGTNILSETVTKVKTDNYYSMKADVPAGTKLKIVIKGPAGSMSWGGSIVGSNENWIGSSFDEALRGNTFTLEGGKNNDIKLTFFTDFTIEFYENGAIEPTKTKKVNCSKVIYLGF